MNSRSRQITYTLLLIAAALVAAILCGCDSPRHIAKMQAKYCPKTSDSTATKIERHDSLIYITSEPLSFGLETPCDTFIRIDTVFKQNGIKETIKGNYKKLTFTCQDDSLKQVIKALNKTTNNKEVIIRTEKCALKHHTGWDSFCNWFTIIALVIGLIFVVIKAIK